MNLNEVEKRMVYQIVSTNQNAVLNEVYMTWRYTKDQDTKATAESLLHISLISFVPDISVNRRFANVGPVPLRRELLYLLVNEALFSLYPYNNSKWEKWRISSKKRQKTQQTSIVCCVSGVL